jgi:hypothetical protein
MDMVGNNAGCGIFSDRGWETNSGHVRDKQEAVLVGYFPPRGKPLMVIRDVLSTIDHQALTMSEGSICIGSLDVVVTSVEPRSIFYPWANLSRPNWTVLSHRFAAALWRCH